MLSQFDNYVRRCPRLGHEIDFKYCRNPASEAPCIKILDCWFETLPVESFIRKHYSNEIIARLSSPPPPKIVSILDAIAKAKTVRTT